MIQSAKRPWVPQQTARELCPYIPLLKDFGRTLTQPIRKCSDQKRKLSTRLRRLLRRLLLAPRNLGCAAVHLKFVQLTRIVEGLVVSRGRNLTYQKPHFRCLL